MAFSAKQVANWFITRAAQDGEFLTQMKLQKLVYIAHGWHLALVGKPLIAETVEAWQWGPVIRSLYSTFADYGASPITAPSANAPPAAFPAETVELLERVWKIYRGYTAAQLSSVTHADGTPWSRTDRRAARPEISNDDIKSHYLELARRTSNVPAGAVDSAGKPATGYYVL